jgi:DNA helicase-4
LYFHQKKDGKLINNLREQLIKHGVKLSPVNKTKLYSQINTTGKDTKFLKLIIRFLSQYKERQRTLNLKKLFQENKDDERTLLFLRIFEIILNAYQHELSKLRQIDFGDMISLSAKLISESKGYLRWTLQSYF